MESHISHMPVWAIVLFIVGFLFSLVVLAAPAKQAALNSGLSLERARMIPAGIILFYLAWLGYTSILAVKGVFYTIVLPPGVIAFATLPLFVILFAFIGNTRVFKKLLAAASLESLIRLHVFRIIGAFFLFLYFFGLLDRDFAFSAGLGDVITAIFAIPVARAVSQKKAWSVKAVIAWNIFGMLDILSLLTIATMNAIRAFSAGLPGDVEMIQFPFSWFPAFAPATILFLHVAIFRKLRQIQKPQ